MVSDERRRLSSLKANLERRALIYETVRAFFRGQGFTEIETPVRMPEIAPELYIEPVESDGWFLCTSPELHMKRLLAAGYDRIFQVSRCFRRGERGRWHNPEFTLLEWYRVGADYEQMLRDTETLFLAVADSLHLGARIKYQGTDIDLSLPWMQITVRDAFRRFAGWDPVTNLDAARFDIDLVDKVIPSLPQNRPVILLDYPAPLASLSRLKPGQTDVAERAEVFICGLELANAYSELADALEQEKRFRQEIANINKLHGRKAVFPQRFIEAIAHMPPSGGIALGMDRMVMLFCNAASIDEVMPFTSDTI